MSYQTITIDPVTPRDIERVKEQFNTVQVGSYSNDWGMGAGYTLVGYSTVRADESNRFLASEMLVLHVHSANNPVGGNVWRGDGMIIPIDNDHDFSALMELIITESGVDSVVKP